MCFQMLHHVDYVDEPDVKQKFEVIDIGGPKPTIDELMSTVKTCAKIWIANHVVLKAIETATAFGRVQPVTTIGDVPPMAWDRGVLFTDVRVNRHAPKDVAHREQVWADHHIQLTDKVFMLQLKDFSYAAQVSFGEVRNDEEKMGDNILIRRECRLKFGLASDQGIIYQLHPGWLELEARKFHTPL